MRRLLLTLGCVSLGSADLFNDVKWRVFRFVGWKTLPTFVPDVLSKLKDVFDHLPVVSVNNERSDPNPDVPLPEPIIPTSLANTEAEQFYLKALESLEHQAVILRINVKHQPIQLLKALMTELPYLLGIATACKSQNHNETQSRSVTALLEKAMESLYAFNRFSRDLIEFDSALTTAEKRTLTVPMQLSLETQDTAKADWMAGFLAILEVVEIGASDFSMPLVNRKGFLGRKINGIAFKDRIQQIEETVHGLMKAIVSARLTVFTKPNPNSQRIVTIGDVLRRCYYATENAYETERVKRAESKTVDGMRKIYGDFTLKIPGASVKSIAIDLATMLNALWRLKISRSMALMTKKHKGHDTTEDEEYLLRLRETSGVMNLALLNNLPALHRHEVDEENTDKFMVEYWELMQTIEPAFMKHIEPEVPRTLIEKIRHNVNWTLVGSAMVYLLKFGPLVGAAGIVLR